MLVPKPIRTLQSRQAAAHDVKPHISSSGHFQEVQMRRVANASLPSLKKNLVSSKLTITYDCEALPLKPLLYLLEQGFEDGWAPPGVSSSKAQRLLQLVIRGSSVTCALWATAADHAQFLQSRTAKLSADTHPPDSLSVTSTLMEFQSPFSTGSSAEISSQVALQRNTDPMLRIVSTTPELYADSSSLPELDSEVLSSLSSTVYSSKGSNTIRSSSNSNCISEHENLHSSNFCSDWASSEKITDNFCTPHLSNNTQTLGSQSNTVSIENHDLSQTWRPSSFSNSSSFNQAQSHRTLHSHPLQDDSWIISSSYTGTSSTTQSEDVTLRPDVSPVQEYSSFPAPSLTRETSTVAAESTCDARHEHTSPFLDPGSGDIILGFGRAESDELGNHTLYDIVVQTQYRGLGLGALLLHAVISKCEDSPIADTTRRIGYVGSLPRLNVEQEDEEKLKGQHCNITLTTEPQTVGFYSRLGFEVCHSGVIVGKVHPY